MSACAPLYEGSASKLGECIPHRRQALGEPSDVASIDVYGHFRWRHATCMIACPYRSHLPPQGASVQVV